MQEEITSTVMKCLDWRWGQWVNQYTEEMNCLEKKLEKLASRNGLREPADSREESASGRSNELERRTWPLHENVTSEGHLCCREISE
ncbi:hypothetical protein Y1Q_0018602 [Alligator mississippiensis]|uniref:Uncharacterized protein n=1 Tax=Alligator mississippiensis TaxID=8496 RepID=A0A151NSA9_ALLMI|nr:hypothetical protein Y1Q_0018602 [Alligator mississippiensis]